MKGAIPLEISQKVETLMEAMPYLQKLAGKVVVIKYGGNAMINEELKDAVMHDVVMLKLLGMKPVLSHGGGPGINKMLDKLEIPVQFINGLRYTSEDIMRVVEMVLIGQVNTELVGFINKLGGKAVGLSGVSGDIYHCHKRSDELGFVGDIDYVDPKPILAMLDEGYIPVVAPVGTDGQGNTYNINGDTAAGKLASALGAEKLILLTDIEGLCNDIKLRD
ncbi:MAG: acetylglutamate kinase, partial [Oscillospiraceae bacterium]|nr:acetylglutamate kinase [Oscillospiraceae bacterium]